MKRILHLFTLIAACALVIPALSLGATSITIGASSSPITWGDTVEVSGTIAPAGVAETFVLEQKTSTGAWLQVAEVVNASATGAWARELTPQMSVTLRLRSVDSSVVSPSVHIRVRPRVLLTMSGAAIPFRSTKVKVRVLPKYFQGKVKLRWSGPAGDTTRTVATVAGRATVTVPIGGVGKFRARATTVASNMFAGAAAKPHTLTVRGRTLREGMSGPDVTSLMGRLDQLGFLIPRDGRRFTMAASETALAFQKVYGLPRTYVWGKREWDTLTRIKKGPQPRSKKRGTHIEVDKSRQVLMLVTNGKVQAIVHVSTGATGNTPVGTFRVYQRGGSYLYKFQAFIGNFGLHGYPSVPPYPASHGCVRQPDWAAKWIWDHTSRGTVVRIYA